MLKPHPLTTITDPKEIPVEWKNWFIQLRDQSNQGSDPEPVQSIVATTGIKIPSKSNDLLIRVISSTAGSTNITANPQISAGLFDGQRIIVQGSDAVRTVVLDDGDGLSLAGAASFTAALNRLIHFHWNASTSLWIENYRRAT